MKKNLIKIIFSVVFIMMCIVLVGFGEMDESVQYINTGIMNKEDESQYVIHSLEELNNYYNSNKDKFDLDYRDKKYDDQTIGFLNAIEKYDEEYFESKSLVIIVLYENGSNIRHKVSDYSINNNIMEINIETIRPEFINNNMTGWHIIIEIDKVDIDDVVVKKS